VGPPGKLQAASPQAYKLDRVQAIRYYGIMKGNKMKLKKLIKKINKENTPPDGWKPEDRLTDKQVAEAVGLETSDFCDDGADLDELREMMEDGNIC